MTAPHIRMVFDDGTEIKVRELTVAFKTAESKTRELSCDFAKFDPVHLLWRLRFEARLDHAADLAMRQYRTFAQMMEILPPMSAQKRQQLAEFYTATVCKQLREVINGKAGVI